VTVDINYRERGVLEWEKYVRPPLDTKDHVLRLVISPNDTYSVSIDQEIVAGGGMFNDWDFVGSPYFYHFSNETLKVD